MTDAKSKVLTPGQVAMEQKQLETWLVNKHDLVTRESLVIVLAEALQSHEALRIRLAAMTDAWKNEMVAKQEALARERALRDVLATIWLSAALAATPAGEPEVKP